MKALVICPSVRPAVPRLAASGCLSTVPILGGCLAIHWIEHLAGLGAGKIQVICSDDEELVRAAVGNGSQWGVHVDVISRGIEPTVEEVAGRYHADGGAGWLPAPDDVVPMSHLPGRPGRPLFESYGGWFAALLDWMPRAMTPSRVRVTEVRPGIWVGSRARISPAATLVAPCWIGDQVYVEAGACVGPAAIVEDRAVVGEKARVAQSWVGSDTFVGPMTSVTHSLAWGSTLIDWRTDSALHVPDPFLLSSLANPASPPLTDRFGRPLARPVPAPQGRLANPLRAPLASASCVKQPG
jgi:hypothetical protein